MDKWDVREAYRGSPFYLELLNGGWEPFAVILRTVETDTEIPEHTSVFFRKKFHQDEGETTQKEV